MDYTVEVYKKDLRSKQGERLVTKREYPNWERHHALVSASSLYPAKKGYRLEIHETYVEMVNLLSGQRFMERYDTPYYCSPSSETYWSM